MGVTEVELGEMAVAVGGPLASELPIEDKASVLGVTELRLVVEAEAVATEEDPLSLLLDLSPLAFLVEEEEAHHLRLPQDPFLLDSSLI